MIRPPFILHLCALSVTLMLTACGGEADGSFSNFPARAQARLMAEITAQSAAQPAAPGTHTLASAHSGISSSSTLQHPEQGSRAMSGFENLGNTCYANSTLKFLIHSAGPERLKKHLQAFAATSDALHRDAAQSFVQLIDSAYSEAGPGQDLPDLFAHLQKLPMFASQAPGESFPIVGRQQDACSFLAKLSQAFALHAFHAQPLVLQDDSNGFKTADEYWTILKSLTDGDSLQEILDRTTPADWQFKPDATGQQLTVMLENAVHEAHGLRWLSNRNLDFNQTVRLELTEGNTRTVLTLEPREVMEFRGTDNAGHYVVYAKDGQWVRYDDDQVTVLSQMPALENVRFINFAIRHLKIESSASSAS